MITINAAVSVPIIGGAVGTVVDIIPGWIVIQFVGQPEARCFKPVQVVLVSLV